MYHCRYMVHYHPNVPRDGVVDKNTFLEDLLVIVVIVSPLEKPLVSNACLAPMPPRSYT